MGTLIGIAVIAVPLLILLAADWVFAGRRKARRGSAPGRHDSESVNTEVLRAQSNGMRNQGGFFGG